MTKLSEAYIRASTRVTDQLNKDIDLLNKQHKEKWDLCESEMKKNCSLQAIEEALQDFDAWQQQFEAQLALLCANAQKKEDELKAFYIAEVRRLEPATPEGVTCQKQEATTCEKANSNWEINGTQLNFNNF